MDECRSVAKFIILSALIGLSCSAGIDEEPNLLNIVEDVITDVANSTQKVIRVNTVDLPAILSSDFNTFESSLYNIQPLTAPPAYVSSRNFRKQKNVSDLGDSPVITHPQLNLDKPKRPKQKQLHMLYNQKNYNGKDIGRRMKVHVAPGAYPIYYIIAKTNSVFRKQPIKGFRNEQELQKYFDKVEKIGKVNS